MKISRTQMAAALAWLDHPTDEGITAAAEILYAINGNRILYANILRRPQYMRGHLEYQLRQAISSYVEGLPEAEREIVSVPHQTAKTSSADRLVKAVQEVVSGETRGIRKDHDILPDDVKSLYDGSRDRWFKMKELHNTLQQMDGCTDEERAPYTQELRRLYGEYRRCLNHYDRFNASEPLSAAKASNMVQKVSAARKYLSENRKKLAEAVKDGNTEAADTLRAKMQARIDLILANDGGFDNNYREGLENLGLSFAAYAPDGKE